MYKKIGRLSLILVLMTAISASLFAPQVTGHSGAILESNWASVIPKINGIYLIDEWQDASHYTFQLNLSDGVTGHEIHDCDFYIKNDNNNLYVCFRVHEEDYNNTATEGPPFIPGDAAVLYFDFYPLPIGQPHDGVLENFAEDGKSVSTNRTVWYTSSNGTRDGFWDESMGNWAADQTIGGSVWSSGFVNHTDPSPGAIGTYTFEFAIPFFSGDDDATGYEIDLDDVEPGDVLGLCVGFIDVDHFVVDADHDGFAYYVDCWPGEGFSPWNNRDANEYADLILAVQEGIPPLIPAIIDIDPDTLNSKSNGEWITCYIELPEGHDVGDIDVFTMLLEYTIPVGPDALSAVGDYDADGIPDLMVKFSRAEVINLIGSMDFDDEIGRFREVTLIVSGAASGEAFEGSDTVKVIV